MSDHTVLLQGLEEDIRRSLQHSQTIVQEDVRRATAHTDSVVKDEHHETRIIVREWGDRIVQMNVDSTQTMDAHLQTTIEVRAQENNSQHQQTQKYVADLQDQLLQLTEQIKERGREFRATLEALRETSSAKKRKSLHEHSNAVAAMLLALQIMYDYVKVRFSTSQSPINADAFQAMLEALKMNVSDRAQWLRAWSESRKIGAYFPLEPVVEPNYQRVDPYKLHGLYFGERMDHHHIRKHHSLVDPETLRQQWDIPDWRANLSDGRYNVLTMYRGVWLLTIAYAGIHRNFEECSAVLQLLADTLWQTRPEGFLLQAYLFEDLQYLQI